MQLTPWLEHRLVSGHQSPAGSDEMQAFPAVAGSVQPILASYPAARGPKPLSSALSLVGD